MKATKYVLKKLLTKFILWLIKTELKLKNVILKKNKKIDFLNIFIDLNLISKALIVKKVSINDKIKDNKLKKAMYI